MMEPTTREAVAYCNKIATSATWWWVVLVGVQIYLLLTLGELSHRDILVDKAIDLHVLGFLLPQRLYFVAAPLAFLIFYALALNRREVFCRTSIEIERTLRPFRSSVSSTSISAPLFEPAILTEASVDVENRGKPRWSLQAVVLASYLALPVAVLVAFQIAYLPAHDGTVTWWHRVCVAIACGMVVWHALAPGCRRPRPDGHQGGWQRVLQWSAFAAAGAALLTTVVFCFCVATVPGEAVDRWMAALGRPDGEDAPAQPAFWLTRLLFDRGVDLRTGALSGGLSRNLVVTNIDLSARDVGGEAAGVQLHGRDLKLAVFDHANLSAGDLAGADLSGAILIDTVLKGANLQGTTFVDARIARAKFAGATIIESNFAGTLIVDTDFDGIKFRCNKEDYCGLLKAKFINVTGLPAEIATAVRQQSGR